MSEDPSLQAAPTALGVAALEREMRKRKLNQRKLAKELGVSPSSVSRWMRGERVPDREHMALLRKALGINPAVWVA